MKLTLMFLISVLVVSTHQYFYNGHRGTYWQSTYSPQPFIDMRQPFIVYFSKPIPPKIYTLQSENPVTNYTTESDNQLPNSYEEPYTFPDTKSRFKGFNRNQPSNEQQDGRFLFSKDGVYTNPFFKTVTFTTKTLLSLTYFVTCVPSNQVLNGVAAAACRRKRNTDNVTADAMAEGNQFIIAPSETQKLTTTAVSSSSENSYWLSSSKDDTSPEEALAEEPSSLRSLLNIGNGVACVPMPPANAVPAQVLQCVTCLPSGYVVCNAAG